MSAHKKPYKRQLRNYLLNSRYQLRFTLFMVLVCAALMTGVGYLVMNKARSATLIAKQQVRANEAYLLAAGKDPDKKIAEIDGRQDLIQYVLIGTGLLLSIGLFLYGIKMTHKVAGPLYKVSLYFDKVKNNKFDKMYGLRKGDQLIEFYEHWKDAHEALRKRQERDVLILKDVVEAAEKDDTVVRSDEARAALADLKALLQSKEASLG